jgi:hypothetical protein
MDVFIEQVRDFCLSDEELQAWTDIVVDEE